jgi:hypothetical protein
LNPFKTFDETVERISAPQEIVLFHYKLHQSFSLFSPNFLPQLQSFVDLKVSQKSSQINRKTTRHFPIRKKQD